VLYCVDGYHSFKSVKNIGLTELMQSCVNIGAKRGKFDISMVMAGRKAVS